MEKDERRMKWGLTPGLLLFPASVPISQTRTDTDNINDVGVSPRFWSMTLLREAATQGEAKLNDNQEARCATLFEVGRWKLEVERSSCFSWG